MSISFEKSALRLEEIVSLLEKGDTTLEKSLQLFEEGAKLSALCYEKLQKAEQKIIEIGKTEFIKDEENE